MDTKKFADYSWVLVNLTKKYYLKKWLLTNEILNDTLKKV